MLRSRTPVVAICAVRTGCGKSQTSRYILAQLKKLGLERVVAIRHPMPYGDLARQAVQRFASYDDLEKQDCTIEEREEYEPYLEQGAVVFAGVDYARILQAAEAEADVIIWDGGNNDMSFIKPNLYVTLADPHRPGHEIGFHPGEANLRMADAILINKIDTASFEDILTVAENCRMANPEAIVIKAASPIFVENAAAIRGKRVLVVEDGPTLTHGGMTYGAGFVAARSNGAAEIVDPRPFAVRTIAWTFQQYPDTGPILPAMGYGGDQVSDLEETINRADVDLVLVATPIDLTRLVSIRHPSQRVRYELQVVGQPTFDDLLRERLPIPV